MHARPDQDLIDAIARSSALSHPRAIEVAVQEWADRGFRAKAASAWLLAGVEDAFAARRLANLGISADQVAIPCDVDDATGGTLGFAYANGDITLAGMQQLIAAGQVR